MKDKTLEFVGTDISRLSFNGQPATPQSATFKLTEQCTYLSSEGLYIEEFVTDDTKKRVWVIHIPKHLPHRPVLAHKKAWQRIEDSLVELTAERMSVILDEPISGTKDWSAEIVPDATVDDFAENDTYGDLGLSFEKQGKLSYAYIPITDTISVLYDIIRKTILNEDNKISPNDITVLGYTTNNLRLFDCYYRYASREKTATMFESIETMYMTQLNYLGKKQLYSQEDGWFKNISAYLTKKLFSNRKGNLYDNDIIALRQHIARLFTIRDLATKYNRMFKKHLQEECDKCGISETAFEAYCKHYEEPLSAFVESVYKGDYKIIRDNKKLHFWMNSGTIKISTINSFKGWESKVIFLVIEPKYQNSNRFNASFDELLYTGLTRCMENLMIINFGNIEYDNKIKPLINAID